MQKITQSPWWVRTLALLILCTFIGTYIQTSRAEESSVEKKVVNEPTLFTPEEASQFGYSVSGIVESSDSITVRALTSGVITKRIVHEGSVVSQGDVLLKQEIPLLNERMKLQDAQNGMNRLAQETSVTLGNAEKESARIQMDSASTSGLLSLQNTTIETENSTALLATQIYGSVTGLVAVLNFIDSHEPYFSGESLKVFRQTVDNLYGSNRSYLSGSVQYNFNSHRDIIDFLDTLTENDMYPNATSLIQVGELVDLELDAIKQVLVSGEEDFFDTKKVSENDPLYSAYLTHRSSIIETQANLRSLIGLVRVAESGGTKSTHAIATENMLRELGYKTSVYTNDIAVKTASQSLSVSLSSMNVLRGEEALGEPKAPFDGVIDQVFVHEGEYVTPGTPLFTLVGSGAKELHVFVPHTMLPYLKTGASFIVEGNVVGYVDRFSPVAISGSVTVVVAFIDSEYLVGETMRGEIECELTSRGVIALPRPFVSFNSNGAYVVTESNKEVQVVILHDTGKTLLVKPIIELNEAVRKATGLSF